MVGNPTSNNTPSTGTLKKVTIYSKRICPYCVAAKNLLDGKNVPFEEIMVDSDPDLYVELKRRTGHMTVPQIFIGDEFIGGYSELSRLESDGELDQKLRA